MIRNTLNGRGTARGRAAGVALAALAATSLLAGLAIVPATSHAAGNSTARIKVSDLNLALARDRKLLERRISAAIDQVCTPTLSGLSSNARDRKRLEQCRLQARHDVQQQLAARGLVPRQVAGGK